MTFKYKDLTTVGSVSHFLLNFTKHDQAEIKNGGKAILLGETDRLIDMQEGNDKSYFCQSGNY